MIGGIVTMAIGIFIGVAIATLVGVIVVLCMSDRRPFDREELRGDDER